MDEETRILNSTGFSGKLSKIIPLQAYSICWNEKWDYFTSTVMFFNSTLNSNLICKRE